MALGSYSWFAIMHELGHALGLSHPGDYNAGAGISITYGNSAQFVQDTEQYSIMSYFGGSYTGQSPGDFAIADTPMLFDIYEMQRIYGVNTATRTGDTVYGFNSNAGSIYDFATNSTPVFCIWDADGTDTLSCSGYSQSQVINLNDGTFSNIGGRTANISIALGATHRERYGGTGNDTHHRQRRRQHVARGGGTDTLDGGSGADTLQGDDGDDRLYGGGASDVAVFTGTRAQYVVGTANGVTTVTDMVAGRDGADILTEVEYLCFADGLVSIGVPSDLAASVYGAPASVAAGGTLTFAGDTFNIGQGSAVATTTYFYLSSDAVITSADRLIGSDSVAALTATVSAQLGTSTSRWRRRCHSISRRAPTGSAPSLMSPARTERSNENNNVWNTIQITVTAAVDLAASVYGTAASVAVGGTLRFAGDTFNLEQGTAAASTTRFYCRPMPSSPAPTG